MQASATKPALFIAVGFTVGLLLISSCKRSTEIQVSAEDAILTIAAHRPFTSLNPLVASDGSAASLLELLYDTLVRIEENGQVIPHLATSWETSDDFKRWRFVLRKGVRFHDGSEMNASDVIHTFNLVKDHGVDFHKAYTGYIESIHRINEHTVEFRLSEPLSTFLCAANLVGIFSDHRKGTADFLNVNFQPMGTGPYRLVKLNAKEAFLEMHEDYFVKSPQIASVVVRFLPNQVAIWAALMRGEVDIYDLFDPDNFRFLRDLPSYQTFSKLRPYYYMMLLNHDDPRFRDVRMRQAINYGVNKKRIMETNLKGRGRICASTIYPEQWAFDETLPPYPYDPHGALKLLKEAGWVLDASVNRISRGTTALEIDMILNAEDTLMPENASDIEQDLEAIGITVTTAALSPGDFFARLGKGEYGAALISFTAGNDPDANTMFWHSSDRAFPFLHYANTDVDRLLAEGRRTLDQGKRTAIYHRLQRALHDDPPGVFLYWMEYLIAVHERFGNVNVKMVSGTYFRDIPNWTVEPRADR